eukprot:COSAG03_NODE_177_length_11096_cov_1567.562062_10_plen_83_part_00
MPSLFAFDAAPSLSRAGKVVGGGPLGSGAWLSCVRAGAAFACARLAAVVLDGVHACNFDGTRGACKYCANSMVPLHSNTEGA